MLVVLIRQITAVGSFMAVERDNNVVLNYVKTTSLKLLIEESSNMLCQKIPWKNWG